MSMWCNQDTTMLMLMPMPPVHCHGKRNAAPRYPSGPTPVVKEQMVIMIFISGIPKQNERKSVKILHRAFLENRRKDLRAMESISASQSCHEVHSWNAQVSEIETDLHSKQLDTSRTRFDVNAFQVAIKHSETAVNTARHGWSVLVICMLAKQDIVGLMS